MKKLFFYSLTFIFSFFLIACEGRNDEMDTTEDTTVTMETNDDTERVFWTYDRDYTYDERSDFERDVKAAMDRLDRKIDSLQTLAENAEGETKKEYNEKIADLKEKRDDLSSRWNDFANATEENWESFKDNVEEGWNDVEKSWNSMMADVTDDNNDGY